MNNVKTGLASAYTGLKLFGIKTLDYGASLFLNEELPIPGLIRSWREEEGIIRFSVGPTDGTTGCEWLKRLKGKGYPTENYIKRVLLSPDFKPTNGVTTEVAVLKGTLFNEKDRTTEKIRAKALEHNLKEPDMEHALLLQMITMEEIKIMGLWRIVAMTQPINDNGFPTLLRIGRPDAGRELEMHRNKSDRRWSNGSGFAFVVSEAKSNP